MQHHGLLVYYYRGQRPALKVMKVVCWGKKMRASVRRTINVSDERDGKTKSWGIAEGLLACLCRIINQREERSEKDEEASEEKRGREKRKRGGHDIFLIARHSFCQSLPFVTILLMSAFIASSRPGIRFDGLFLSLSLLLFPHPSIVSTMRITATV
jgi:hypothetical protein